jgi:hypothetical protein
MKSRSRSEEGMSRAGRETVVSGCFWEDPEGTGCSSLMVMDVVKGVIQE